ncbi:MAG: hypothetical protein WBE91_01385 [Steroidobacteraceae bacterium]
MTVLVTGSAGHLGEAILGSLRREGVAVVGLDRKIVSATTPFASAERDVLGGIAPAAVRSQ